MTRLLIGLLLPALLLISGCRTNYPTGVKARYVGDIQNVLAGKAPTDQQDWIPADGIEAAFGAGSPESWDSLGEMLTLRGVVFTKSTDPNSPDYYGMITGERMLSSGAIVISRGTKPSGGLEYGYETNVGGPSFPLQKFYEDTLASHGQSQPFIFVGLVQFERCELLGIAKAPIFGEAIMENRASYYTQGKQVRENVTAVVVACAADFRAPMQPEFAESLARILYNNPYDQGTGVSAHAHALILSEPIQNLDEFRPELVEDVNHLLSQSTVSRLRGKYYLIRDLAPLR